VLGLVAAAVTRLDDLRVASERFNQEQIRHVREMAEERERSADVRATAETARVNAIRGVDVMAAAAQAAQLDAAVQKLAVTTQNTADNLRATLVSTAQAMAVETAAYKEQLNTRLTLLERANYEDKGRAAYSDPQLAQLVEEVKSLRLGRSTDTGQRQGIGAVWGWILGGIALVGGILGIIATLIAIGTAVYAMLK
jgi:hypothetical protein